MRFLLGLAFCCLLVLPACGDEGGSGPPGTSGGGTGGNPDPDEIETPIPGTCLKLCCSDTDCAAGQSCTAFDATAGTLGVCTGTPTGAFGEPPETLPAGCWSNAACNPLANTGCAEGRVCDYSDERPDGRQEVACFGDEGSTEGPGEKCDVGTGLFCIPGFHCLPD
jgi:hypothetical protein